MLVDHMSTRPNVGLTKCRRNFVFFRAIEGLFDVAAFVSSLLLFSSSIHAEQTLERTKSDS